MSVTRNIKKLETPNPRQCCKRRERILAAAETLYLEQGLTATTMDKVATRAGVAKQTVYSHFKNKEKLFTNVIARVADESIRFDLAKAQSGGSPRAELTLLADQLFHLITSEKAIFMHRMLASPDNTNKDITKAFYQAGPKVCIERLTEVITRWTKKGQIQGVGDPGKAAVDFLSLLKGIYYMQFTLGLRDKLEESEIRAHISETLETFFRIYPLKNQSA